MDRQSRVVWAKSRSDYCDAFKNYNGKPIFFQATGIQGASMLVCDCTPFYIKFNEETDEDDSRPQCCIDHDKYFSTCDTCEFGGD